MYLRVSPATVGVAACLRLVSVQPCWRSLGSDLTAEGCRLDADVPRADDDLVIIWIKSVH